MRILTIEDEAALRELIEYDLTRAGFQCLCLDNANDALIAVEDWLPELILLDLMLPGLQGLQFLEIIRKKQTTPVIVISARNSEKDIIAALDRGADDYVTKPFTFNFLEAKIRAVMRRGQAGFSAVIEAGGIRLDLTSHRVKIDNQVLNLTQKEFELLSLFMRSPGQVFSRNQLLNAVWGYDNELISRTVDAHVATLRKKLADKGRYIQTLPKIGYAWEVE
ncbi:MAG: winged helix-turn-helix domain-containing protein [Deltaproteobacteria bacterium]|jgi:two-component system phosphate regulon response regulator PhoB|nr:winged helix-turn-helix domain-containing protein [Deltaproteobacteria bacterium]